MKYLRHPVAALVIFATLVTLFVGVYQGLETNYGFERTPTSNGYNVMENLEQLNIITGMNQTMSGVYELNNPTGNTIDVLGALASAGIGVIQIVAGLITFPIEIVGVLTGFYYIPPIVSIMFLILIIIYVAFIILSAYLRGDV